MNNNWKSYFLISLILLVISSGFGVFYLILSNSAKQILAHTESQLTATQTRLSTVIEEHDITTTKLIDTAGQLSTTKVQLREKENQLNITNTQLSTTKGELNYAVTQLTTTEDELADTVTQLTTTEDELADTVTQLTLTEDKLADTVTQLTTTEDELADTVTQLTVTEGALGDIVAQLASAEDELADAVTQLTLAEDELADAVIENTLLLSQYANIRAIVEARIGYSFYVTEEDRQSYITPDDATVSALVQATTDGYTGDTSRTWNDYFLLYQWVADNIVYNFDSYMPRLPELLSDAVRWVQECWNKPAETIADGKGDCEDQALLLASMMKNYNNGDLAVWLIGIQSAVPGQIGHMAVAFPVEGGHLTIVDPTWSYYTGWPSGSLESKIASSAVSDWVSLIPDANFYVYSILSNNTDQRFSSTAEFLTWFEENR